MTTVVHSNGSKWLGEEPDSLGRLFEVLGRESLNPGFELYGNFVYRDEDRPGTWWAFGNFLNVSHVFRVETDDPELVARLTEAVRANQATSAYQAERVKMVEDLRLEKVTPKWTWVPRPAPAQLTLPGV